jgi:hypothetical protein
VKEILELPGCSALSLGSSPPKEPLNCEHPAPVPPTATASSAQTNPSPATGCSSSSSPPPKRTCASATQQWTVIYWNVRYVPDRRVVISVGSSAKPRRVEASTPRAKRYVENGWHYLSLHGRPGVLLHACLHWLQEGAGRVRNRGRILQMNNTRSEKIIVLVFLLLRRLHSSNEQYHAEIKQMQFQTRTKLQPNSISINVV